MTGYTHLFEHMMFQGSDNVGKGEHLSLVANNGGNVNGDTTPDCTMFYETLPANQLDLGLFIEADRMRSLVIDQANLDGQRAAAEEERRQRVENQPYGKAQSTPLNPDTSEAVQTSERRKQIEDPFARRERIDAAFKIPPGNAADFASLDVLSGVLSNGSAGRLYQKLVKESEVALSAGFGLESRRGPSLAVFTGTPAPGKSLAQLEQLFLEEIVRIQSQGVSESELIGCAGSGVAHSLRETRAVRTGRRTSAGTPCCSAIPSGSTRIRRNTREFPRRMSSESPRYRRAGGGAGREPFVDGRLRFVGHNH